MLTDKDVFLIKLALVFYLNCAMETESAEKYKQIVDEVEKLKRKL